MRRLVVAGLALALVAGACGTGTSKATDATPKVSTVRLVSSAADAADRHGSARITGAVGFSLGDKEATVPIEGAIDFRNQAVEMKMSMAGFTGGQQSGDVEIRMVDGVMYMNMGSLLPSQFLGGKPWVSVDTGGSGGQGGTQNPADVLSSLRGAGNVERIGHGEVDGVEADHYRVEIDVARAMAKLPIAQRDQAEAGMKMLGSTFPMDVWIDGDGLPVRIAVDFDAKGGAHISEHIEFTDWGAEIDVTAPPVDQVQSLDDVQSGASTLGA